VTGHSLLIHAPQSACVQKLCHCAHSSGNWSVHATGAGVVPGGAVQTPHVIAHIVLMYHLYSEASQYPAAFHAIHSLPLPLSSSSEHGLSPGILPLTVHWPLQPSTACLVSAVTLNSVTVLGCEQWIFAVKVSCAHRRGSMMQPFIVMQPKLVWPVEDSDGAWVGRIVGGLLGANDGVSVGTSVGLIGESVGVRLGWGVGAAVGVWDGLGDGECVVGENVGV